MAKITIASLFLVVLLLQSPLFIIADPPSSGDSSGNTNEPAFEVSPAVAVILIVFIAAFFLSGIFFVALRKIIDSWCCGLYSRRDSTVGGDGGTGPRRVPDGLTRQALQTIPVYFYKDVKMHRQVAKGELECAVCLNEFGDNEVLRVLPKCRHVLHPDCVDPWLLSQATCPVCRTFVNLEESSDRSVESDEHICAPPPTGQERSTLRLPEEAVSSTSSQFERARSERRGFRASIPWLGRARLNQENKVDTSRFAGSIRIPSVSHLV